MKKRLLIGVVITSCHIDFQEEILKGIISQAFRNNCNIAVLAALHHFAFNTPQKEYDKKIFELILSDKFDGFLYERNTFHSEKIKSYIDKLLERSGKPVMLLDSHDHRRFETTAIDDFSAFEQITDHLIDVHGCNKIYCLTGPRKAPVSEERLNGFRSSMKKHGLYYDRKNCIYGDFWEDAAKNLAGQIISGELNKPDAVVCGNDHSAVVLAENLINGGIRVPEDIAVTGYDNTDEAKNYSPPITTFSRPNFQLGAEAFRRLYRIITGKICNKVHNNNGGIIFGRSCGCSHEPDTANTTRREKINAKLENDIFSRDMLFDVSSADSIADFADKLDNYTYYIYKMKRLEIYLTKKYLELSNNLSFRNGDKIQAVLSKSSVRREDISGEYFSSSEILPIFSENRPYPCAYYISPLHYNDNFFGYSAVSFGKEAMSFSKLYLYWTNIINISLEHLRIKSILKNTSANAMQALNYDENTGMSNRDGLKKSLADMAERYGGHGLTAYFIRIQITGLDKIYFQSGEPKCLKITACFADFLKSIIRKDEICGIWTDGVFCIITAYENRNEDIIPELIEKLKQTQFTSDKNCNIDFVAGLYSQEINTGMDLSNAMHKASVNRIFNYNISESNTNPQFEKLCMLRGRIMKNPEKQWIIDDIADELYLSKSYLQKIYKSYFGKSIIEEMIIFRIEKAKELLRTTSLTVTDISRKCGYSSYNYFVRQFKILEGVSPSEYRSKCRTE